MYLEDFDDMDIVLKEHGLNFFKEEKRKVPKMKKDNKDKYKKTKLTKKS